MTNAQHLKCNSYAESIHTNILLYNIEDIDIKIHHPSNLVADKTVMKRKPVIQLKKTQAIYIPVSYTHLTLPTIYSV